MEGTITLSEHREDIDAIVLEHRNGYQLKITPAREGFLIHSSQGIHFRRYDALSYEVVAEQDSC